MTVKTIFAVTEKTSVMVLRVVLVKVSRTVSKMVAAQVVVVVHKMVSVKQQTQLEQAQSPSHSLLSTCSKYCCW